jgi:L-alanine-DL-glutamate epimerase-like enolase superfamily enzyme
VPFDRQFRWMIEKGVLQVVQPHLFYFGGMIRALRVAQMAEASLRAEKGVVRVPSRPVEG